MPKPTILISIDVDPHIDTAAESFGRSFIQSLCDEDGRLVPELVSTSENYKDPFISIDHYLSEWWAIPATMQEDGRLIAEYKMGSMWKRKSALASRGMIEHGNDDGFSGLLWFECRWAKDVDFDHLFEAWVGLSHPEIGMLHVFTEPELHWQDYENDSCFRTGSFGNGVRSGPANMGWAMAYGREYAHEVDAARIKAAGFPIDERDGVTVVRVTEKLNDVVDDFERFSRRRAELKALFRPDLFWITQEPSERERDPQTA